MGHNWVITGSRLFRRAAQMGHNWVAQGQGLVMASSVFATFCQNAGKNIGLFDVFIIFAENYFKFCDQMHISLLEANESNAQCAGSKIRLSPPFHRLRTFQQSRAAKTKRPFCKSACAQAGPA